MRRILRAHRALAAAAWCLRRRGFQAAAGPYLRRDGVSGGDPHEAERCYRALQSTRRLPWSSCLTRSLALCRLLRARGDTPLLALGVAARDGTLLSHAWVVVADRTFGRDGFQPLSFPGAARRPAPPLPAP